MQDNTERAQRSILLILVILFLEIIAGISGYLQLDLLERIKAGDLVTDREANLNDLREGIVALVYTITYIVSVVFFIQWFRRAYNNLHQVRTDLSYEEGWASGAWFVPFLNLVRPYQIMRELYQKTEATISEHLNVGRSAKPNMLVVNLWWALWILVNLISQASTRIALRGDDTASFILGTRIAILASVLGIPLCLVTVQVIRQYVQLETDLRRFFIAEEGHPRELDLDGDLDILDAYS